MLVKRVQEVSGVYARYTLVWAAHSPGPAACPSPLTERSQMAAGREEGEGERPPSRAGGSARTRGGPFRARDGRFRPRGSLRALPRAEVTSRQARCAVARCGRARRSRSRPAAAAPPQLPPLLLPSRPRPAPPAAAPRPAARPRRPGPSSQRRSPVSASAGTAARPAAYPGGAIAGPGGGRRVRARPRVPSALGGGRGKGARGARPR